jgi:hypothetical protein
MRVWPIDVRARVQGDQAEVAAIEHMEMDVDGQTRVYRHVAINLFRRVEDRWLVVGHRVLGARATGL